jgi:hypothetical protein
LTRRWRKSSLCSTPRLRARRTRCGWCRSTSRTPTRPSRDLRKQVALAEADRDQKALEKHDAINAKLAREAELQAHIDDLKEQVGKPQVGIVDADPSGAPINPGKSGVKHGG